MLPAPLLPATLGCTILCSFTVGVWQMGRRYTLIASLAAFAFLFGTGALLAFEQVICRAPGIEGMDASYNHAKAIIGNETTTDKENIKLYVEYAKDGFYFHSNFCTGPCTSTNFPTKIFVLANAYEKEDVTLEVILNSIIHHADDTSQENLDELDNLLAKKVQVFVETSVFDGAGTPRLDLSAAQKVVVVSATENKTVATEVLSFKTDERKSLLASRILGCCLSGIPPMAASRILTKLKATAIDFQKLKIASFVPDTATARALKTGSQTGRRMLAQGYIHSDAMLANAFSNARDSTLLLMGHVEDAKFVVRGANNQIQFSVDFSKLRQLASDNNVNVAFIGCKTATEIASETLGAGVVGRFNTVKAVQQLESALSGSTNLADFLSQFASDDIKVVITSDFADKAQDIAPVADVYSKTVGESLWIKVAQFFLIRPSS
jgi:hypothetical protein